MRHPAQQIAFGTKCLCTLQAVECAVNLLYNLGEGAAEELLHPSTGSIAQLVAGASSIVLGLDAWLTLQTYTGLMAGSVDCPSPLKPMDYPDAAEGHPST